MRNKRFATLTAVVSLFFFTGMAISGRAAAQAQTSALAPTPAPSPAATVWKAITEPTMDPAKTTVVENLVLTRDRIRLTLENGTVEFTTPAGGKPFGAIFGGKGVLEVAPPNPAEQQQLHLYTGQDTLRMPFTEGVFWFTDRTYEEIAAQAHWNPSEAIGDPLFAERTRQEGSPRARLFKGILSLDHERTALFEADLYTEAKGWIQIGDDALEEEEITAGRWVQIGDNWKFETWLSFPAHDRSVEAAIRDPLAKADFHVASYQIEATLKPSAEFEATVHTHLEMLASGEQVLLFHLDPHLRIDRVADDAGHALTFFQPPDPGRKDTFVDDFVAVALAQPSEFQPATLEFHYAGTHVVSKVGDGNYSCESFGWYPAVDNAFATRSDFDLTFRSPKLFSLVATGDKVSENIEGDWRVTKWKSDPATSVAGFAFGDYKVEEQKAGDVSIDVYANRTPDGMFAAIRVPTVARPAPPCTPGRLDMPCTVPTPRTLGTLSPAGMSKTMEIEMGNMVRLFTNYYGPYPYHSLAITNIPGGYGQGWPGLIYLSVISFLDQTQQEDLGLENQIESKDYFRAHVTSFQWWAHKVERKSYHDQWLSDGFAEFSGNLYVEFNESQEKYLNRIQKERDDLLTRDIHGRTYESLGPIWMGHRMQPTDEPGAYQTVIGNKGGYVLHMLRMMLRQPAQPDPDGAFKAMMQDYTETYKNKAASTGDFKAIVEKHMVPHMDLDGNHRMDWFFNQYVYGTGVPQYRFSYSSSGTPDGKTKVHLIVDRTGVPAGWRDTLPVYLYRSDNPQLIGWMGIVNDHETMDFTLPSEPEKIAINVNEDILATIKQ